jgi:hypothetical protein
MPDNSLTAGTPQFGTAEYAPTPGNDRCKTCNQPIVGQYYRVNGALTCAGCALQAERQLPKDSHAAYLRGILFGIGGALLGLIIYSAFGIMTGLVIGYISLAVGYIVGKAIKLGSGGMGGRRYQIAAAVLTYAAVSMAAIPIAISQSSKKDLQMQPSSQVQRSAPGQPSATDELSLPQQNEPAKKPSMNFGVALLGLALLGLASPLLELQNPFQGLIGLVILSVGIRIAWRLTEGAPAEIIGPFGASPPLPVANNLDAK